MYLLFDIGATKMRLGISVSGNSIQKTGIVLTPKNFTDAMGLFEKTFKDISNAKKVKKVSGGIRGVLNTEKTAIEKDFLLTDWVGKPLAEEISRITKSEVFLENDTALCGLGEANFGVGKGYKIVSFITISSGVGGVRIVDGEVDKNIYGFEPGHQIIDADGSLFEQSGKEFIEFEDCVSGFSLKSRFGKDPQEISDRRIWEQLERFMAIGIGNTILHWSSDLVIIGGGIIQNPQISFRRVEENIKKYFRILPSLPEIKKGKLKDLAGLYGALLRISKD